MEFVFTEEQEMIRDSAEGFLAEVSNSEAVRQSMESELGYDEKVWQSICQEMCWQTIHIPEAYGGMGLGYVELVALLEVMGKRLLCSPFFSTICLGANALIVAGNEDQKNKYLSQIAAGEATATLAYTGNSGSWDADSVEATYEKKGNDYILNGEYRYIPDGHNADLIILAARSTGSSNKEGISLFIAEANSEGLSRELLPTMDQTKKQASLFLKDLKIPEENLMSTEAKAWDDLDNILHLARIAIAAEQMGGAQQVLDLSVEYALERTQFNRPIASFQAVKHKAADMMLKAECAKSAVYYAACVAQDFLEGGSVAAELPEAANLAKAYCSDAYFFNAGSAIQLHGGVGFTWEYDVHLYFKRAKSSETFLGNGAKHREELAKIILD